MSARRGRRSSSLTPKSYVEIGSSSEDDDVVDVTTPSNKRKKTATKPKKANTSNKKAKQHVVVEAEEGFSTPNQTHVSPVSSLHSKTVSLIASFTGKEAPKIPSDAALTRAIHEFVRKADLDVVTTKQIRERMEHKFSVGLSTKTEFIKAAIRKSLRILQNESDAPSEEKSTVEAKVNPPAKRSGKSKPKPLPESMPLILACPAGGGRAKKTSTLLLQLPQERQDIDLSTDVGAVGRLQVKGKNTMLLDLKGQKFSGELVPCPTLLVVSVKETRGEAEARIEACMSDVVLVKHEGNMIDILGGQTTYEAGDAAEVFNDSGDSSEDEASKGHSKARAKKDTSAAKAKAKEEKRKKQGKGRGQKRGKKTQDL